MLTIYVRHTQLCLNGDGEKKKGLLAKGLTHEQLNAWKYCDCPKWYSGMLNGRRHPRTTLKANTWDAAEMALDRVKEGEAPARDGTSIEHAAKAWLEEAKMDGLADATQRQRERVARQLAEFCATKKITHLQSIEPETINGWRQQWGHLTPGSAQNRSTNAKMFFRFCQRMKWIKESPMALLKILKRRKRSETDESEIEESNQTLPLDEEGDANYRLLLKGIELFFKNHPRRTGPMSDPKRLIAITELMYESGLRVLDAMLFLRHRMEVDEDGWGEYTTIQTKTSSPVTVGIPPHVVTLLQALKPLSGRYLFYDPHISKTTFYNYHVWAQLRLAGEEVGLAGVRPHRLRDSFAVNRLNEGMLMQEVSKLLGHSKTDITEKYYAPHVKSRKKAIMASRKAAHDPAPGRKVVSIGKRRAS